MTSTNQHPTGTGWSLDASEELLGGMAHEIRNPLAALQGCAHTLVHRGEDLSGDQRRALAEVIWRQAGRLDWLVGALFATASPPQGNATAVDLAELVTRAAAGTGVEVDVDGRVMVAAAPQRAQLACEALLAVFAVESCRATVRGGSLEVRAQLTDLVRGGRAWKLALVADLVRADGGMLDIRPERDGTVARLVYPSWEARCAS